VIDLTLSQLLMRACAVLVVSSLQGFAIAAAAGALGDAGPRHDGRLSLDPLRQVDPLGGLVGMIFAAGWGRWAAIDPRALRHGRCDLPLVVGAGFAAIVVGVLALRFGRPLLLPLLPDTAAALTFTLMQTIIELGLWFALFSLLPLPPLAGGHLLIAVWPRLRERLAGVQLFLGLILAVLVASGMATRVLDPAYRLLFSLVMGEAAGI
jgi:Zn-dependent protease